MACVSDRTVDLLGEGHKCDLRWGVGQENLKNIAKGTTDPKVEFWLQK